MGCVESRPESGSSVNTFQVVNINEHGQRQKTARLEITETHLVLHQRGRTPICWPLRCLRRYGFDAEQFSFESGRRSPSGPGIYTFKCRRAEHLFNLLQYRIQNIAEDPSSRELWPLPLREQRNSITLDSRRSDGVQDSQGYELPNMSVHIPTVPNPPILNTVSGANGRAGGGIIFPISGIHRTSITGPPAQPVESDPIYINESAVVASSSPPQASEEPVNTQRPEVPTVISINEPPAAAVPSERQCSYSSSSSERPAIHLLNHIDRCPTLPLQSNTIHHLHHFTGFAEVPQTLQNTETPMSLSYENIETAKDFSRLDDFKRFKNHPIYMNVDTDRREDEHIYVNLSTDKEISLPIVRPRASRIIGSAGSRSSYSGTATTTDTEQPHITYIQVDVERNSDSSQTAPLSPQESLGSMGVAQEFLRTIPPNYYATIDFGKTDALRETAKVAASGEIRGELNARRTRHNSNTGPMPSLGRHLSLLSE